MRRLPGILLLTAAALTVVVALLVRGSLRLVLPQLDAWRPQLLEKNLCAFRLPGQCFTANGPLGKLARRSTCARCLRGSEKTAASLG